MTWDDQWLQVVFSDEKKWNLDGPDGWKCYWHDLRKEKEVFSKRQFGGASIMTWGCFSFNGVGSLAFISGKMNSVAYKEVLEDHLLPNAVDLAGEKWVFQQDNAPIHNSKLMKTWFKCKNIQVLDWPSRSPDLNPIENLWGDLARRVYSHGRQYSSPIELRSAIENEWYKTDPLLCQSLILSMKKRIFQLIRSNGGSTKF